MEARVHPPHDKHNPLFLLSISLFSTNSDKQDALNELQSTVGDVLMASKPLLDRLDPRAANLTQSETRLLSRDVLLLKQAVLGRKRSLEVRQQNLYSIFKPKKCRSIEVKDSLQIRLQQQNLFQAQLEALEKQMQNLVHKVQTPVTDTDSAKVRLSFPWRLNIII